MTARMHKPTISIDAANRFLLSELIIPELAKEEDPFYVVNIINMTSKENIFIQFQSSSSDFYGMIENELNRNTGRHKNSSSISILPLNGARTFLDIKKIDNGIAQLCIANIPHFSSYEDCLLINIVNLNSINPALSSNSNESIEKERSEIFDILVSALSVTSRIDKQMILFIINDIPFCTENIEHMIKKVKQYKTVKSNNGND